jgi:hypothetical protein
MEASPFRAGSITILRFQLRQGCLGGAHCREYSQVGDKEFTARRFNRFVRYFSETLG